MRIGIHVTGESVLVGVDVGATTTHVRSCRDDGAVVHDEVVATVDWRGASAPVKAGRLAQFAARAVGGGTLVALGVGAHGCDTEQQCRDLADAVRAVLVTAPCVVVNDARLVGPAAGRDTAIGVIAGTGSIAVGVLPDGGCVYAGGWGWLLGDEGGAAGIVRESVRALLRAEESDRPDPVLAGCLAEAAGVASVRRLPLRMMTTPAQEWARYAPAVFRAAQQGSPLAVRMITEAGSALADLVEAVIRKGATADAVVAAGGTITGAPMLADAFRAAVLRRRDIQTLVLGEPPVVGAVALARRALAGG
ncbi:MAG TPA: BadF/BadG/BcrA/BcrD ATPase family protein [Pseudonocardiaceae bacterium]|nr:BadF/BadG/BcrA/BcrD ATPase family protein [Pseudonocardiaceae bacterium]